MLNFDIDRMLFTISGNAHSKINIKKELKAHPEVQYVSFVGVDIGGHDTDEKIPVDLFLSDMDNMLERGVQTDGSSVALPGIAVLNNAKVAMIPDMKANWYVDYNYHNIEPKTGLPVGTLRIPSILVHNDTFECGSRVMLRDAIEHVRKEVLKTLKENPYVFKYLGGIGKVSEIEDIIFTSATELEFWVKTPDDKGDREQLFTSQVLKEQYWKRTYGEVRTALEDTLKLLDKYGLSVEMGHKEVGGVKARMGNTGHYDHVMEQLEIDWKYADALQTADNENQAKYVVRDIFTMHGLDVTFMAKPFPGVAGSGEHTHLGMAAVLKNGKTVNLFAPKDMNKHLMSPIGFGAIMGLLKNYEVVNPFISATNDAFNRLKPGYEAPVCVVTSLGISPDETARNRTVLAGLIREGDNPNSLRFELRAPNPKSNTYLVLASSYMAILDGIKAALTAGKTPEELEKSLSKKYGQKDFYLEKDREYRTERNVFDDFTQKERDKLFGKAPSTVWENITAFERFPKKTAVLKEGGVMPDIVLESYVSQVVSQWKTEVHDRIIPSRMDTIRSCIKLHDDKNASDLDKANWAKIDKLRKELGKDTLKKKSLLTKTKDALDLGDYDKASKLQLEIQEKINLLVEMYSAYTKNIF